MYELTQPRAVDPERLQRMLVVTGWALLIAAQGNTSSTRRVARVRRVRLR